MFGEIAQSATLKMGAEISNTYMIALGNAKVFSPAAAVSPYRCSCRQTPRPFLVVFPDYPRGNSIITK